MISPIDPAFKLDQALQLPLPAAKLDDHKGTPLAAFGISEADLVRIQKTLADDDLTLANLSKIARYAWLGQGLSIPVKDLLTFEALTGVGDIFASPKVTLDFIDQFDWIKKADSTVEDLDYLLRQSPESPLGLREEVIVQLADALRDAIRADKTGNKDGVAISQVAGALQLTNDQAKLLVETCKINGKPVSEVLVEAEFIKTDDKGKFVGSLSLSPQDRQATMAKFGDVFSAYRLLHKAAIVVARFKLDAKNLKWLLANAGAFRLLTLDNLPVLAAPGAPLFPQWLNLAKFTWFKDLYPEPETMSLRAVLDLAGGFAATLQVDIEKAIASLTQWELQEVTELSTALDAQTGATTAATAATDI